MTLTDFIPEQEIVEAARISIHTLDRCLIYEETQLRPHEPFSLVNINENLDTIETHRKLGLETMSQTYRDDIGVKGNFIKLYQNPSYAFNEVIASVILLAADLDQKYKMSYRLAKVKKNDEYKYGSVSSYFPKKLKSFTQWLLEFYYYKEVDYFSPDYDDIELLPKKVTQAGFVEDVVFIFKNEDEMELLLESLFNFFNQKQIVLSEDDREVLANYIEEYKVCRCFDTYVLNTDRSKNNLGLFSGESAPLFDLGMSFNTIFGYKQQRGLTRLPASHYPLIACNHQLSNTLMRVVDPIEFSEQIIDELIRQLNEIKMSELGDFIKYSLSR